MEIIRTNHVAAMLGVSDATVKRWSDTGLLPCIRTAGGHRKFRLVDIHRFLGAGDVTPSFAAASLAPAPPITSCIPPQRTPLPPSASSAEAACLAVAGDDGGLLRLLERLHSEGTSIVRGVDTVLLAAVETITQRAQRGETSFEAVRIARRAVEQTLDRLAPTWTGAARGRVVCVHFGDAAGALRAKAAAMVAAHRGMRAVVEQANGDGVDLATAIGAHPIAALIVVAPETPEVGSTAIALASSAARAAGARVYIEIGAPTRSTLARRWSSLEDLQSELSARES